MCESCTPDDLMVMIQRLVVYSTGYRYIHPVLEDEWGAIKPYWYDLKKMPKEELLRITNKLTPPAKEFCATDQIKFLRERLFELKDAEVQDYYKQAVRMIGVSPDKADYQPKYIRLKPWVRSIEVDNLIKAIQGELNAQSVPPTPVPAYVGPPKPAFTPPAQPAQSVAQKNKFFKDHGLNMDEGYYLIVGVKDGATDRHRKVLEPLIGEYVKVKLGKPKSNGKRYAYAMFFDKPNSDWEFDSEMGLHNALRDGANWNKVSDQSVIQKYGRK